MFYPIPGYRNQYEITECGIVKQTSKEFKNPKGVVVRREEKILTPFIASNKALAVKLNYSGRKRETHYVHRLIARTFMTSAIELTVIKHRNGNKQDNRIANLHMSLVRNYLLKPEHPETIGIYDKKSMKLIRSKKKLTNAIGLYLGRYKRVQSAFSA